MAGRFDLEIRIRPAWDRLRGYRRDFSRLVADSENILPASPAGRGARSSNRSHSSEDRSLGGDRPEEQLIPT